MWDGRPAFWKGIRCHQTPDDLWNYQEVIPTMGLMVIEVGPGDLGTANFLRDIGLNVTSVGIGDPVPSIEKASVILDGDVYSEDAVQYDLETYATIACHLLVICHTIRPDWGSSHALRKWLPNHPEWTLFTPRHPTQHSWLWRPGGID